MSLQREIKHRIVKKDVTAVWEIKKVAVAKCPLCTMIEFKSPVYTYRS